MAHRKDDRRNKPEGGFRRLLKRLFSCCTLEEIEKPRRARKTSDRKSVRRHERHPSPPPSALRRRHADVRESHAKLDERRKRRNLKRLPQATSQEHDVTARRGGGHSRDAIGQAQSRLGQSNQPSQITQTLGRSITIIKPTPPSSALPITRQTPSQNLIYNQTQSSIDSPFDLGTIPAQQIELFPSEAPQAYQDNCPQPLISPITFHRPNSSFGVISNELLDLPPQSFDGIRSRSSSFPSQFAVIENQSAAEPSAGRFATLAAFSQDLSPDEKFLYNATPAFGMKGQDQRCRQFLEIHRKSRRCNSSPMSDAATVGMGEEKENIGSRQLRTTRQCFALTPVGPTAHAREDTTPKRRGSTVRMPALPFAPSPPRTDASRISSEDAQTSSCRTSYPLHRSDTTPSKFSGSEMYNRADPGFAGAQLGRNRHAHMARNMQKAAKSAKIVTARIQGVQKCGSDSQNHKGRAAGHQPRVREARLHDGRSNREFVQNHEEAGINSTRDRRRDARTEENAMFQQVDALEMQQNEFITGEQNGEQGEVNIEIMQEDNYVKMRCGGSRIGAKDSLIPSCLPYEGNPTQRSKAEMQPTVETDIDSEVGY